MVLAVLARSNWAGYGPVSPARSVRVVAVCGAALVVLETVLSLRRLGADPPLTLPWNATVGVPDTGRAAVKLTWLVLSLGVYLMALARVTAGSSAVEARDVAVGGWAAASCAAGWLGLVARDPGAGSLAGPALAAMVGAGLAAALLSRRARTLPAGEWAGRVVVPALLGSAGAALAINVLIDLLPLTGAWVANNAPPTPTTPPSTRLVDGVVVYLPGLLLALALSLTVRPSEAPSALASPRISEPGGPVADT